ncbi:hypothetical protein DICPUDRAFT_74929 [Dictyostelium purpureum]|uniref:Uncharacterized protein n=1 Tax=Dictyostelium purpureum TaxID=5786 RepID=F0Z956_DICPU|nr:uncharacterized protein DICPUDRAFT_74929 [Dictyostelium purpureum]EGC39521.1 hypothetical protein DICPUDRAFT_74929 [Dictyostelium purpureum]|eukprot:XP_003283968.1 hypothetical protein DICPUDRAFT_74929 [Dictyostelium purpureum]
MRIKKWESSVGDEDNNKVILKELNQECDPFLKDCKFGSSCINLNGKNRCILEQSEVGGYCNETVRCKYSLECIENICKNSHFLFVGEKCYGDYECISTLPTGIIKCVDGICRKPKGVNNCTSNQECPIGTVCHYINEPNDYSSNSNSNSNYSNKKLVSGYCEVGGKKGELCHNESYPCKSGLLCQSGNDDDFGICTEYYNGIEGSNCKYNYQCQLHNGLYCSNFKCKKYNRVDNKKESCGECSDYFECEKNGNESNNSDNSPQCRQYTYLPGSEYFKKLYQIQKCKSLYEIPDTNEINYSQYSPKSYFSKKCGIEICSSNIGIDESSLSYKLNDSIYTTGFKIRQERDKYKFNDYCLHTIDEIKKLNNYSPSLILDRNNNSGVFIKLTIIILSILLFI